MSNTDHSVLTETQFAGTLSDGETTAPISLAVAVGPDGWLRSYPTETTNKAWRRPPWDRSFPVALRTWYKTWILDDEYAAIRHPR